MVGKNPHGGATRAPRIEGEAGLDLRALLDDLPGLAYRASADPSRALQYVSEGVSSLTGHPVTAFTSGRMTWSALVHPDDVTAVRHAVESALQEHRGFSLVHRIVHASGVVRWVLDRCRLVSNEDAEPIAFQGFVSDVTQLHQHGLPLERHADAGLEAALREKEEQLRDAHERLSMALRAGQAGLWDWDMTQEHAYVSPEYRDLYGLTAEEPFSYGLWLETIEQDDRERVEAYGREVFAHGTEYVIEFRINHPTRGQRWLGSWGMLYRNAEGHPVRFSGVNLDITPRKQAEEVMRRADRHKDEFLATLAHELRNPLAPIRTGLDVLKRSADAGARERAMEMMERQVRHMVRLVDDQLDVARISHGQLDLKRELVSLQEVVQNAVEIASPFVEAREHALVVRLPDEPVWVDGDLTRLTQAVGNLLHNSTQYTPMAGHIELELSVEGEQAVLRVSDDGMGIPAAILPGVFDLFARAARDPTRAQGGLGIGLFLTRRLVEMHAGTITGESPGKDQGSTFTIRLPLAAGREPAVDERPDGSHAASTGRRILIVDDNEDAAELLAIMLGLRGHQTRVAYDGPSALELAASFAPDVAFLDIGLPGMSGHELARRFRADPALAGTLLIALTGWGGHDDRQRTREAGFDHHLTKPADAASIEGLLAQH